MCGLHPGEGVWVEKVAEMCMPSANICLLLLTFCAFGCEGMMERARLNLALLFVA